MKHYEKLFEIAKKNTTYNSEGHAVIKKDDEWVDEIEWEKMFNKSEEVITKEWNCN